jgi:hypothetical protein
LQCCWVFDVTSCGFPATNAADFRNMFSQWRSKILFKNSWKKQTSRARNRLKFSTSVYKTGFFMCMWKICDTIFLSQGHFNKFYNAWSYFARKIILHFPRPCDFKSIDTYPSMLSDHSEKFWTRAGRGDVFSDGARECYRPKMLYKQFQNGNKTLLSLRWFFSGIKKGSIRFPAEFHCHPGRCELHMWEHSNPVHELF